MSAKRPEAQTAPAGSEGEWTFELIDAYDAEIDRVARITGWTPIPTRSR
jgi:hypothetical protein